MTDNEKIAEALTRIGSIASGMSKATRILGFSRDQFVMMMSRAAEAVKGNSPAPFQSECPGCGKKITVAFVNGQRRVKWDV